MFFTRKGDDGSSGLFATNERLPKSHNIYAALGTLDELNSLLGLCRVNIAASGVEELNLVLSQLEVAQEKLFSIQAGIAGAETHLTNFQVVELEAMIAELEPYIPSSKSFVVAGATTASAWLDYARTVARRTEREVVALERPYQRSLSAQVYLNRLSSLLYVQARYAAAITKATEKSPQYECDK